MGFKRIPDAALFRSLWVGLCCGLVLSCTSGDKGLPLVDDPPPPASLSDLFGTVLLKADGNQVGMEALEDKAFMGIFFSAGWCPACGAFTPQFLATYQELKESNKSFEVVLISFDDDAEGMFAYMRQHAMPWLAIPHGSAKATALVQRYDVRLIPTLIVIDKDWKTISMNGRGDIVAKGAGAYEDWMAASTGS
jgi:thiol-disulfide isomerase/thioredoxin